MFLEHIDDPVAIGHVPVGLLFRRVRDEERPVHDNEQMLAVRRRRGELACQIMTFHPPSNIDDFKSSVQDIAGIAVVGSNICPDSFAGHANCADLIDSQAQDVLDNK